VIVVAVIVVSARDQGGVAPIDATAIGVENLLYLKARFQFVVGHDKPPPAILKPSS